ncbi:hypothetical protein [Roseovarius ramblicola]|uniref:Uncharacterized protein n=1 Tax=Roseovarius ramblicola TaxID=2022336 RepID=A0ABV5I5R8_9RHOB
MTEIFTRAALAQQTLPELHVLFRQAQAQLVNCELGSHEHFAHAANLQNVRREIAIRTNPAPRP